MMKGGENERPATIDDLMVHLSNEMWNIHNEQEKAVVQREKIEGILKDCRDALVHIKSALYVVAASSHGWSCSVQADLGAA
jgi:hypothetical protein